MATFFFDLEILFIYKYGFVNLLKQDIFLFKRVYQTYFMRITCFEIYFVNNKYVYFIYQLIRNKVMKYVIF